MTQNLLYYYLESIEDSIFNNSKLFITMKTKTEYSVSKTKLSDGDIYFIGSDYMVVLDHVISFKNKKITDFDVEDIENFKRRLDYIADNKLTIIL